jgi:hypothetical protein
MHLCCLVSKNGGRKKNRGQLRLYKLIVQNSFANMLQFLTEIDILLLVVCGAVFKTSMKKLIFSLKSK